MRTLIAGAVLAAAAHAFEASDPEMAFNYWLAEYGKNYSSIQEYRFRLQEFTRHHLAIEELQQDSTMTSTVRHNYFSDFTEAEFNAMLGTKPELGEGRQMHYKTLELTNEDSVNWVDAGAVTPVKNQGSCGSCWAFSTTGSMEGANQIATGELVSLSEQQFVDCDKNFGDMGCRGGLMDNAFQYAETTPIETEEEYRYRGLRLFGHCDYEDDKGVVKVTSFTDVELNSPDQLKAALQKQPVSVAIQANKPVFQFYSGGVITSEKCGTKLDHGVLAVGYGTDDEGTEYFLVKNSWGKSWGEHGYVKLGVVEGPGICGIQSGPPSYPET